MSRHNRNVNLNCRKSIQRVLRNADVVCHLQRRKPIRQYENLKIFKFCRIFMKNSQKCSVKLCRSESGIKSQIHDRITHICDKIVDGYVYNLSPKVEHPPDTSESEQRKSSKLCHQIVFPPFPGNTENSLHFPTHCV